MDEKNRSQAQAALLIDARLAKSTLFQEKDPHIHVVPSTSNPGPLGFFSFGFCALLLMGIFVDWVEPATALAVYGFGFTFGGLGQLIVGLLEFHRKNTFASNAFLVYGLFWMGTALNGTLQAAGIWEATVKGAQMSYGLWGCITFFFWVQTFVINGALCILFGFVSILFFLLAAAQTRPGMVKGTGAFGVVTAIVAFYIGLAIFFIEMYGKEILPMGTFNWSAMRRRFGPVGTKRFDTGADATNV